MKETLSLDDLWDSVQPATRVFDPAQVSGLPEGVRLYLEHAIAAGTPLASAVRLRMHGEIKLKRWHSFTAEQVILWNRGMIWQAAVRMFGMPLRGGDFFLNGNGAMRWKLLGILPAVNAAGPDISRSAADRINIESIWLPSVLCGEGVSWSATGKHLHARFSAHGESAEIDYIVNTEGRIEKVSMKRWGNPDGGPFHYSPFGALVEEEDTFGGYTIPVHMRVGWSFGTNDFEQEGEFFRVRIDDAIYR